MEPQEYDAMMRRMLEIVVRMDAAIDAQGGINERLEASMETSRGQLGRVLERVDGYMARLDGYMDRMEGYMRRQEGVNASVASTLADIQALLARVVRGGENGREA